jgi:hypothetical protein
MRGFRNSTSQRQLRRAWRETIRATLSTIILLACQALGKSADYSWSNPGSGVWSQTGNWTPATGFPSTSLDNATLDSALPLNVAENSTISIRSLSIPQSPVTLNVGGALTVANALILPGFVNLTGADKPTGIAGQLKVTGGSLTNQGTLNVGAVGALGAGPGGTINWGVINLLSPINPPSGGFSYFDHITGDVTNRGTFEIFGNNLNVECGGPSNSFTNHATLLIDSGATLAPYQGTLLNATDGTLAGGGVIGNGIGGTLNNHGLLSPGDGLGRLSVNTQTVQLFADGTLQIQIGGVNPGVTYDQLALRSAGIIGGNLDLEFVNGFVPVLNETFSIVTGSGLSGQFINAPGNVITTSVGTFAVSYSASEVLLTVVAVPEPSGAGLLSFAAVLCTLFRLRQCSKTGADGPTEVFKLCHRRRRRPNC